MRIQERLTREGINSCWISGVFRKALEVGKEAFLLCGFFLLGILLCKQQSAASLRKGHGKKKKGKCKCSGDPPRLMAVEVNQRLL